MMTETQARAVVRDVMLDLAGMDADEPAFAMLVPPLVSGAMSAEDMRAALAQYLRVDPDAAMRVGGARH